jgi:hypothetical protein
MSISVTKHIFYPLKMSTRRELYISNLKKIKITPNFVFIGHFLLLELNITINILEKMDYFINLVN